MFKKGHEKHKLLNDKVHLKSEMTFKELDEKVRNTFQSITGFTQYIGISRGRYYQWGKDKYPRIPLYVERIFELIEKQIKIEDDLKKLYESNTLKSTKFKPVRTKGSEREQT